MVASLFARCLLTHSPASLNETSWASRWKTPRSIASSAPTPATNAIYTHQYSTNGNSVTLSITTARATKKRPLAVTAAKGLGPRPSWQPRWQTGSSKRRTVLTICRTPGGRNRPGAIYSPLNGSCYRSANPHVKRDTPLGRAGHLRPQSCHEAPLVLTVSR